MEEKIFIQGGSEYITGLIEKAVADGTRTAVVSGNHIIDTAVRIPCDFTLVLDGCHLKMADGCFSNMFVNEHHDTLVGRTVEGTDRNIKILGKNNAVLDGGKYNGLHEKNAGREGRPPIWKNNLILFTNTDGIEMANFACRNNRWWAFNFIFCANGYVHDIDFKSCDIGIDENGNEYHGLFRDKYSEILVKNADGVDLRQGCHDFVIENLTGFIQDDTVACTALNGGLEKNFKVEGLPTDICNVTIKNVATASYWSNVRLLNQGEIKLHDITIDGVTDMSKDSPCLDRGLYGVRVGDVKMYGTRHATADETYNITIKNVRSRALRAALSLVGDIGNLNFENIEAFEDTQLIEDLRGKV